MGLLSQAVSLPAGCVSLSFCIAPRGLRLLELFPVLFTTVSHLYRPQIIMLELNNDMVNAQLPKRMGHGYLHHGVPGPGPYRSP